MKSESKTHDQLLEEEEVISKAKRNPKEFRVLYERYYKIIYLFILRRVGQKDESADVCAQVFLKALVNINRYESRGLPFSAWLFRIAINECNTYFRTSKHVRTLILEDSIAENLSEDLFGNDFQQEMVNQIPQALQQLDPQDMHIIELRFFEERSYREVGAILGITENYAKVRTYRALERIRKLLVKLYNMTQVHPKDKL